MREFLDKLKEDAFYIKVKSKKEYGGAVQADDVLNVLKAITTSYQNYIKAEYSKINNTQERAKLKAITSSVIEENKLLIVDLKFESFGMNLVPNTVDYKTTIPYIKDPLSYKKEKFTNYQNDFLFANLNSEKSINNLIANFSDSERKEILTPLIEGLMANPKITCFYSKPKADKLKKIPEVSIKSIEKLIPKKELEEIPSLNEPNPTETIIAKVEVTKTGKSKFKILDLFNSRLQEVVCQYHHIVCGDRVYNLKIPISAVISSEENEYTVQNDFLGIIAVGESLEVAELNFAEEFDYIYNEYQLYKDEELSSQVKEIRDYLKFIVLPE